MSDLPAYWVFQQPFRAQTNVNSRISVIGVGNEDRGDDAVGLVVARLLRGVLSSRVTVLELRGRVDELLEIFNRCQVAILVDAAKSGAAPGTIHKFEAADSSIPTKISRGSTHAFGIGEALELARVLNRLPSRVTVYAIEGCDFEFGHTLSPEVERAAAEVVANVLADVERLGVEDGEERRET